MNKMTRKRFIHFNERDRTSESVKWSELPITVCHQVTVCGVSLV